MPRVGAGRRPKAWIGLNRSTLKKKQNAQQFRHEKAACANMVTALLIASFPVLDVSMSAAVTVCHMSQKAVMIVNAQRFRTSSRRPARDERMYRIWHDPDYPSTRRRYRPVASPEDGFNSILMWAEELPEDAEKALHNFGLEVYENGQWVEYQDEQGRTVQEIYDS